MQPNPAEIARTLSAGRLAGTVQVAWRPQPFEVRHATDCAGQLLLLSQVDGDLAAALASSRTPTHGPLQPAGGAGDVAVVLRVEDVPPVEGAPSLGQLWAAGWAQVVTGPAVREAALEFAEANPDNDLLGVGRDFVLHRVDVAEVRLGHAGHAIDIDIDDYVQAEPDPLHAEERELLVDLAEHHADQTGGFIRRRLAEAGHAIGDGLPRVVRIDRYGLTATAGRAYRARLSFPRPVRDRDDLRRIMHPVPCGRCQPAGGYPAWPMSPAR